MGRGKNYRLTLLGLVLLGFCQTRLQGGSRPGAGSKESRNTLSQCLAIVARFTRLAAGEKATESGEGQRDQDRASP